MTPIIEYNILAKAKTFYEFHGYPEIPVPWIISHDAYYATKPSSVTDFYVLNGYMNASGEQSFIDLMLQGEKLTKHCCITPCFRQEPILDETHHTYFMKLELIDTDVSKDNLKNMIDVAQTFFNQYTDTYILKTDQGEESVDIVDTKNNIELGSYGIRRYKEYSWIYGTGVALPRLSTVINKNKHV